MHDESRGMYCLRNLYAYLPHRSGSLFRRKKGEGKRDKRTSLVGKRASASGRRGVFESRRKVIRAGVSGAGAAIITLTSLNHLHGNLAPILIRPPGALPEKDFLARCIRCGECMKACPTNTLQPVALVAGFSAFFSPKITPRRGPCEPLCNVCGHVCPTGAIRALPVAVFIRVHLRLTIFSPCRKPQKNRQNQGYLTI